MSASADRIVITGAGLNCCLGVDREQVWQAVKQGRCGIGPLTALEQPDPQRRGGQNPDSADPTDEAHAPRAVRHLRRALREALNEAGLIEGRWPAPDRVGIVLGTTLAGMRACGKFLRTDDPACLREFLASSVVKQAAAGYPIEGLSITTCAACASGLSAAAIGVTLLRLGILDVVVAGGYDPVSEYVYAGFDSLRLVAEGPPLPFSSKRQGMNLGEGSAVIVLEQAAHAEARGVAPLAAILGFGETSDAHHLTQPQPEGMGASKAILAALSDAGVQPDEVDMISAHATSTPNNDAAEFAAYRRVFVDRLPEIPVTAFKSHLGHTLGAAGAVELILSMMCMREGMVAPVANMRRDDIEFEGLKLVTDEPRPSNIRHAINLSLGFGGANSCIVLGKIENDSRDRIVRAVPRAGLQDVLITGVGVIAPGCIGNEAFRARLRHPMCMPATDGHAGDVDENEILPLFANARRVRRFSTYVKLVLAATTAAIRDAGLDGPESAELLAECGAFLGSAHGALDFTERFYRQVVNEGIGAANPMLFAEGVPNIASAQVSLLLNLRGSCQTIVGGRTAGLDALHIAARRIASGVCERAIVGAAEEFNPAANRAYESCGLHRRGPGVAMTFGDGSGFVSGAGAAVVVLESRRAAERRGASALACLEQSSGFRAMGSTPRDFVRATRRALDAIGRPGHIVGSANNTWIDRLETAALADESDHGCAPRSVRPQVISSIYGHLPEMFAVMPLASVIAVLLMQRIPRFLRTFEPSHVWQPANGQEQPSQVGFLCIDYDGTVAATRLRIERR